MIVKQFHLLSFGLICSIFVIAVCIVSLHIGDVDECLEADMTHTGIICHGKHIPIHTRQAAEKITFTPFIGILGVVCFSFGAMYIIKPDRLPERNPLTSP